MGTSRSLRSDPKSTFSVFTRFLGPHFPPILSSSHPLPSALRLFWHPCGPRHVFEWARYCPRPGSLPKCLGRRGRVVSTPFPRCFNLRHLHELPSLTPLCLRFLLHYIARDEVALHERGTGGVPEIRNAIEGYEECSPLYGFLQYRRRKVIIRYMPEGLSRLILGMPIQPRRGFSP